MRVTVAPGHTVTVAAAGPAGGTGVILGHGAGSTMDHPSLIGLVERLAALGILAVRYNFPYTEAGRKAPDRQPLLLSTVTAVADAVQKKYKLQRRVLGGRSMGGRMASLAVADGLAADGLAFLAYPLHPAGKPEELRTAHWPNIRCPMRFYSGTRDTMAQRDLLEKAVAALRKRARLIWIDDAGHDLVPAKRAGVTGDQVLDRIALDIASSLCKKEIGG